MYFTLSCITTSIFWSTSFEKGKKEKAFRDSTTLPPRFYVAMGLFSTISQMTLKCDKNKKVAH